jgi:hypothetical protein
MHLVGYYYKKNCRFIATKLSFFVEVIVQLAKFSHCEEYVVKHEKIQIYNIMKTICRYRNHKRSRSSKLKLLQKYVYAYMFIFMALNS